MSDSEEDEEQDPVAREVLTTKSVKPKSHVICAVPRCSTYGSSGFSMHNFPTDSKLFEEWKRAVGLKDKRTSAKRWKVCGKHFQRDDYILPTVPGTRKKLKRGAIPSLNLQPTAMKSTVEFSNEGERASRYGGHKRPTASPRVEMLKREESDDAMDEEILPDEDRGPGSRSPSRLSNSNLASVEKKSKNENSKRSARASSTDTVESKSEKKLPGTCCIPSCNHNLIETRNEGLNISYYRFPQDKGLCQAWKAACGPNGPELNTRVGRICSVHFKDSDFERGSVGKRGLKPKAIPSLYLQNPPEKKPTEPKKRKYIRKSDLKTSDEEIDMPRPIQEGEITIKSEPESEEEEGGCHEEGNYEGDASGHLSDYFPGEGADSDEEFEYNKKGKRRKIETRSGQTASTVSSPASSSYKKKIVRRKPRACPASKKNFSLTKPVVEVDKLENGVVSAAAEGLVRVKSVKKKSLWNRRILRDIDSDVETLEVDISTDEEGREGEDEEDSDEEVTNKIASVGGDTVLMIGVDNKEVTVPGPPIRKRPWQDDEANKDEDDEDDHKIVEIQVNPVSSDDEENRALGKVGKQEINEANGVKKRVKCKSNEDSTNIKISIDAFDSGAERGDHHSLNKSESYDFRVDVDSPASSSSEDIDDEKSEKSRGTPTSKDKHPNQSLMNILESEKSEKEKIIKLVEQRISEHTKIIEGKQMGPQQLADHNKILQGSALVLKTLAEKTKKPLPLMSVKPLNVPSPGKHLMTKKGGELMKKASPSTSKGVDRVQLAPLQKLQPSLLNEDAILKEDPSVKDLQNFSPLEKVREYDNLMKKYLSALLDKNVLSKKLSEMKESIKSYETKLMEKQKEVDVAKKKISTLQGRISRTHTALSSFLSPNQIKLALQETKKVAWTPEEMLTAFTIKHLSKACYLFLRHKLNYPLPGISSLQRWMTTVSKGPSDEASVATAATVVQEVPGNVDDEDLSDHESLFNVDAGDVIIEGTLEEINSHETEQGGGNRAMSDAGLSRSIASSSVPSSLGPSQQQLRVQSQPRFVKIFKEQPSDKLSLVSRNLSEKVTIHKITKNVEQNQTKVRPNLDNLARSNDKYPASGNVEERNASFSSVFKEEERSENSRDMIVDEGGEFVGEDDLIEESFDGVDRAGMKMIKLEQNPADFEEGQTYFTLSDINGLPDAQVISSNVSAPPADNPPQKYFHQITIDGKIENRLIENEESHDMATSDDPQVLKALIMNDDEEVKNTLDPVHHQVVDDSQQPKLVLLRDPGTGEDIISFLDRDESILNLVAGNEVDGAAAVGAGGTALARDLAEAGYSVTFLENYVIQEAPVESGVQPAISDKA